MGAFTSRKSAYRLINGFFARTDYSQAAAFVSTRFLDYARNDRVGIRGE